MLGSRLYIFSLFSKPKIRILKPYHFLIQRYKSQDKSYINIINVSNSYETGKILVATPPSLPSSLSLPSFSASRFRVEQENEEREKGLGGR